MSKSNRKLNKQTVDSIAAGDREKIVFDSKLAGFGLRVQPSGVKSYFVQYRSGGRTRRYRLGRHGQVTPERARQLAQQALSAVASGEDPSGARSKARKAPTVAELAERFDREHIAAKLKPRTQDNYRWSLAKLLLPAIGTMKVADVTRADLAELHYRHRTRPYPANRMIEVARKMFSLAEIWGWRVEGTNPAARIPKYKETKRERFLSERELEHLVETLAADEAEGRESAFVVAAFRLLILTGCRLSEIQTLQWDAITTRHIALADSKTGARRIQLTQPIRDVLSAVPRSPSSSFVIEGKIAEAHISDLQKPWRRIRKRAGIEDVRIHDLRHTYASRMVSSGETIQMVGKLLGHSQIQTTMRYAHLADDAQRRAAEKVAASMPSMLGNRGRKPELRVV